MLFRSIFDKNINRYYSLIQGLKGQFDSFLLVADTLNELRNNWSQLLNDYLITSKN